jgi:hypothetical protein
VYVTVHLGGPPDGSGGTKFACRSELHPKPRSFAKHAVFSGGSAPLTQFPRLPDEYSLDVAGGERRRSAKYRLLFGSGP